MENNIERNDEIKEPEISEEITEEITEEIAEEVTENSKEEGKKPFPLWIVIVSSFGVAIAALVLIIILMLGANKGNDTNNNQNAGNGETGSENSGNTEQGGEDKVEYLDYSVTVLDELCNPVSDVIVKFTDKDGATKIKVTNTEGKAVLAEAIKGDYTVLIESGPSSATIFDSTFELTPETSGITTYVCNTKVTEELVGDVDEGAYGYSVSTGTYTVYTRQAEMTYLIFTPTQSGVYKFAITDPDTDAVLGYYGISGEVSAVHLGGKDYDGVSFSLTASYAGFSYVIGIENSLNGIVNFEIVRTGDAPIELYGAVEDGATAFPVGAGEHTLEAEANKSAYVVFTAGREGVYKIYFVSDDMGMTVGYYGNPMVMQPHHCGDGEYDGKSFEMIIRDAETPHVIGINFTIDTTATLVIERIGDPPFDPQYAPWTYVEAEEDIEKCTLPAGSTLKDIDVTDPSVSVHLGDDGYYYTSDGKLVYVRIGSVCNAKYLDVSVAYIAGFVDQNFGNNFGGYVYDENGEFVGKYSFNGLIKSYYESCDANGVCPLTAELANAIQIHGNSAGWWKFGTVNYLFNNVPLVVENAWLFLCCTVE